MGKVGGGGGGGGGEKKRKKKKGRPSLLDLQKRSLKQQSQLLKKHNKNLLLLPPKINNINNTNINTNDDEEEKLGSPEDAGARRSTRRNPNPNPNPNSQDAVKGSNNNNNNNNKNTNKEEEEGRGRKRKRKIDSVSARSVVLHADDVEDEEEEQEEEEEEEEEEDEKQSISATNQANVEEASDKPDDGPFTPLPDKKLLLFILERLQKKDTYGVFAEPVDPEELPDYHEIIEHPMDFTTVRKKLEDGAYGNLEQFEKDIFLICSNAMQYNAPDTIYFRQASSIQELAMKNFENLRQDSDDNELDQEPKVARRGRPPKFAKRPPGRPPLVRANSDFTETVHPTAGGTTSRSNIDHKKGSPLPEKHGFADSIARTLLGSRSSDAYTGRSAERFDRSDDMMGSSSKGISMRYGKRQIVLDENRRNTYKHSNTSTSMHEPSVLTTFQRERKQLIAVGLHTEYGYARSLARFAAKLGPVAWKVASKKIERCLPSTVKFGPGWVGENEAPSEKPLQRLPDTSCQSSAPVIMPASASAGSYSAPTQGLVDSGGYMSEKKPQREQLSEIHKPAVPTKLNDDLNKATSSSTTIRDSSLVSSASGLSNGDGPKTIAPETSSSVSQSSMVNMISNSIGPIRSGNSIQIQQIPTMRSQVNGVNGSYGPKFAAEMGKLIGSGRPNILNCQSNSLIVAASKSEPQSNNGCGEAKVPANSSSVKASDASSDGVLLKKGSSTPPDLNVGFHSPGSPGSGKADSVHTDLALQL
ncbi:hypothetical protein vseg_018618 [Gypsophila vaccaria]